MRGCISNNLNKNVNRIIFNERCFEKPKQCKLLQSNKVQEMRHKKTVLT